MSKTPGKMSQSSKKVDDTEVTEGFVFQQPQLTCDIAQRQNQRH